MNFNAHDAEAFVCVTVIVAAVAWTYFWVWLVVT